MLGAVLGLSLIAATGQTPLAKAASDGSRIALGSSFARVALAYPQARALVADGGERELELTDVSYGGGRWSTVDYVFDGTGRLARVRLSTRALSFAQLRAQLQTRYDAYLAAAQAMGVSARADDDLQLRICQSSDGAVSLTYEKPTTVL